MKPYKYVSAREAVRMIKSGDNIHVGSVASAPQCLIDAMCERGRNGELKEVSIFHLHTEAETPYVSPEFEGIFRHNAFFIGSNVREGVNKGNADYIPVFLGETGKLYRNGIIKCDVAMIQVSPPDEFGFVSLGTSVDASLAAVETAACVIAVVNKYVPRTFGDSMIHTKMIDLLVENDTPLFTTPAIEPNEIEKKIAHHCSGLIENGACLQMGIGNIPNAVLSCLENHKNLGIHTEMFADGVIDLVEKGVINGQNKVLDKGKIVSTFLMGSQRVYDFANNNPQLLMKDVTYTNDPFVISRQKRMTAINSAIQVDITGQVCADSFGTRMYSGVGGQVDFIYGASRAPEGKAIIAMPSTTSSGISKIVFCLETGAGVVTTRNHIHWLVTEFGAVNLYGKPLKERAGLIISVAHPAFREKLTKEAYQRFGPLKISIPSVLNARSQNISKNSNRY